MVGMLRLTDRLGTSQDSIRERAPHGTKDLARVVCRLRAWGKVYPTEMSENVQRCVVASLGKRANTEETKDERTRHGIGGTGPQVPLL